eukprot:IDg9702t1
MFATRARRIEYRLVPPGKVINERTDSTLTRRRHNCVSKQSRSRWLATQERDTLSTIHNGIIGTEPLREQAEEWRMAEQRIPARRITAGDNCEAH